jgi:hypothetical protein
MSKINNETALDLLKLNTKQKIISFANEIEISPEALLDGLINDEIERHRLLNIFDKFNKEDQKAIVPSQKIAKICNKHLSILDHESEGFAIREALESLYIDLLRQKIIFVNSREGEVVESKRLKTARVDYYWYAGILAKNIARCFGVLDVYLWHELLNPFSEIVFVGMPTNVEVCYQVFLCLYPLFKKIKATYKKNSGNWGSKKATEEVANRYMCDFAQELDHTQAYIENDNFNKFLYDYVSEKFAYTMRD